MNRQVDAVENRRTVTCLAACTICKKRVGLHRENGISALIRSVRHKGLRRFFDSGGQDVSGINPAHREKLSDQLAMLDAAREITDMDIPGWNLHALKGRFKSRYSVRVSGNWRLTFEFANGDAQRVDYEDYH